MNWPAKTPTLPTRSDGFTLIEMLIVLAILGMALGLIVNRGPMRSERLTERDTATTLAEALRETRGRAIAEIAVETDILSFRPQARRCIKPGIGIRSSPTVDE